MAFFLKKFAAFWLTPVPFCAGLVLLGLWLTRKGRTSRTGRRMASGGALLLLVLSNNYASAWLLRPLEARYAPIPEIAAGDPVPPALSACRYVVVLGGGHADMDLLPASSKLSDASRARVMEGVRLCRILPDARLIVSGPPEGDGPSHASVVAKAAVSLGIPRGRIVLVETARDTGMEAAAVRGLAAGSPVALVTSASHMPRAMAEFRSAGVDALPCPADFRSRIPDRFELRSLSWDAESLGRSAAAIHERLGQLWMLVRGALHPHH
jgi:uncharacterized SAM-binding protein YcdF (DUF218 family)